MPINDYFQEYGPIHRRRSGAQRDPELELALEPRPEPVVPERRRATRRRATRRRLTPLQLSLLLAFSLGAVLLTLPFAIQLRYQNQALPGVSVQGLAVAGQERAVISSAMATRYADFQRRPITLTYGGRTWQPSLEQLGVRFDTESITEAALAAGREGDLFTRIGTLWTIWREGWDVTPRMRVDQRVLQNYLLTLAPEIEHPPQDAALSVAEGKIIGTPSAAGRQLLIDQSTNDILAALQSLAPQTVALRSRLLDPTIGDAALLAAQGKAKTLLGAPLVLTHGERSWTWDAPRVAELLRVESSGSTLEVELDGDRLNRAVERLAQFVNSSSAEPRLRFSGGQLRIVREGQPGWKLKESEAAQVISTTLHLNQPVTRTLALPVDELRPRIDASNLDSLGIREMVGEGRSSFSGSAQYRITNIKAGAARMDGVLIAPGEEFSFNTQLGEVNAENGFVEGYAVIGNRTQLEWGGGVCQDSTTVFRAAFWAGLPISERHAHPFYISWYDRFGFADYGDGAGLDATIYTGVNDLKFVNDTGNWLLMHAYVDDANQVMTIRLYGTRTNRTVTLDGPYINNETAAPSTPVYINDPNRPSGTLYQSDVARSGRDIMVYRVIKENGVEVKREQFFTRFKAWPNVYVRGTG